MFIGRDIFKMIVNWQRLAEYVTVEWVFGFGFGFNYYL